MEMKSGGMLNAALEYYERLDGVETILMSPAEPLDLRLRSRPTGIVGSNPATGDTEVNKVQHSKMDVEVSEWNQRQTSVRSAETEEVHTNIKTSQLTAQQGVSVFRPTPIYCCRALNTSVSNTGINSDDSCSSKNVYQAASLLNIESSSNKSVMLNVPLAHSWNCGTKVSQGMMGIFSRKTNHEFIMKSDRWNCGPKFGQDVTRIVNRKAKWELMKLKKRGNGKKCQDERTPGGRVADHDMVVTTDGQNKARQVGSSTTDTCGVVTSVGLDNDHQLVCGSESQDSCRAVTFDGMNKDDRDQGTRPGSQREGTDTSSENDNSFEVLFEYLTNRDRQSSSEALPYTAELEDENKLLQPVLQGCEDILEPKPLKERFVGGGGIPDLVEPLVSPSPDFIEGCGLSPFSVFNQFSDISKRPNPILLQSSSLSFMSSEDEEEDQEEDDEEEDEEGAAFSPHTKKPVATVLPFHEESVETYSTFPRPAHINESAMVLHAGKITNQQHGIMERPTVPAVEVGVQDTAWDLTTRRDQESLTFPHTGGDSSLVDRPHHDHGKRLLYSSKPTPLSSTPTESALFLDRKSVLPSLHEESTLFSHRKSDLPSLHKESSLFSHRESELPSLHRESLATLPSLHRESIPFQNKESNLSSSPTESSQREPTVFPHRESTASSFHRKSNMPSADSESILAFPYRHFVPKPSDAITDLISFVQRHPTAFEKKTAAVLSMSSHCKNLSPQNTPEMYSALKMDFERDIKMPSSFNSNLEESDQGMSEEMISTGPTPLMQPSSILISLSNSPMITSSGPNSPILSSVPNSPILTSMPNSQIFTLPNLPILTSMPNSTLPNSPILSSMPNSPILTSMPNSQILNSSAPNSQSVMSSMPKFSLLTSPVSNLKVHITPSVPNSPTLHEVSPYFTTEKSQQGARLSPPMKHKQMLIEKYKMSGDTEKSGWKSEIDQCDTTLCENATVEKPAVDSPRTRRARKGRKQKLFQSSINLSFTETGKQGNSCRSAKERKLFTPESTDYCESAGSSQNLQPHDLQSCETFYWCHVCEKTVKCEQDANRHQTIHGYNTKANLLFYYLQVYGCVTLHWRGYNRAEKCVYLCGLCDRTIPYINGFKRHIQTHGNNVCCDVCNKQFDDTENLREHKLSHSESKPCDHERGPGSAARSYKLQCNSRNSVTIKCRYCGKFFSSRSSLTIHVRLHTGQNPYKCRLCDRSYPQNVQLKLHMKAHVRLGDI